LFRLQGLDIGQLLLTRSDVEDRRRFIHIRNTVLTLLRHGIVPVINENDTVAVDEIRFGDNDSLAGLAALVSEADRLVLLTDIDGLYTANPRTNPEATLISEIVELTDEIVALAEGPGSAVGTGGMRTKMTAAKMAVGAGVEVVIANGEVPDNLLRISEDQHIGTWFHPRPEPVGLRKSWLMHAPKSDGTVVIDDGAVKALLRSSGSLLLPGVTEVRGSFHEGGIVALEDVRGRKIGKGIASFASKDLVELMKRRKSGESLHDIHEVIHRNDMALVEEADR
jgi:glutamate 5-kinase